MAVPAVNIVIEKGIDYEDVFTVRNPDGSPLNLTGYTGIAKIRKFPESTSSVSFNVTILPLVGQIVVSLANTVTNTLDPGRYYYDVVTISSVNGKKKKIVDGMILVRSTESL